VNGKKQKEKSKKSVPCINGGATSVKAVAFCCLPFAFQMVLTSFGTMRSARL